MPCVSKRAPLTSPWAPLWLSRTHARDGAHPGRRGYGFIIFEQWTSAKAALQAMQGREVGGRRMDVQPAGMAPRSDPVMDDLRTNPGSSSAARFSAQSTRSGEEKRILCARSALLLACMRCAVACQVGTMLFLLLLLLLLLLRV